MWLLSLSVHGKKYGYWVLLPSSIRHFPPCYCREAWQAAWTPGVPFLRLETFLRHDSLSKASSRNSRHRLPSPVVHVYGAFSFTRQVVGPACISFPFAQPPSSELLYLLCMDSRHLLPSLSQFPAVICFSCQAVSPSETNPLAHNRLRFPIVLLITHVCQVLM